MEAARGVNIILPHFEAAATRRAVYFDDMRDPYLPLLGEAMLKLVTRSATVQDSLLDISKASARRNDTAADILQLLAKQVNDEFLYVDENLDVQLKDGYPEKVLDTEDKCTDVLSEMFENPSERFQHNTYKRVIQTNEYARYVNLKLLSFIHPNRMPPGSTYLDIGTSQGYGLKWMKRNAETDKFPLPSITVIDPESAIHNTRELRKDQISTFFLNTYCLPSQFSPGDCHGVDCWAINDPDNKRWEAACKHPGEYLDKLRLARSRELGKEIQGVTFSEGVDAANSDDMDNALKDLMWDTVFISVMLKQNSPEDRILILANAEKRAKEFVCLFEPLGSAHVGDMLHMPSDMYELIDGFGFKFMVKDMRQPKKGYQEYASYRNGRCHEMTLNYLNQDMRRVFP